MSETTMRSLRASSPLATLQSRFRAADAPRTGHGLAAPSRSLTLATWNIRELGKSPRRVDSIRYLAEVLRLFDLTVIIELRESLTDLRRILRHLGPSRRVLFSEPITDAGGNRERIAFLYDARAIEFTGLASHLHAPREKSGDEYLARVSWWRPPYVASFRAPAAGVDFVLAAAHIRWGSSVTARLGELAMLADWATHYVRSPNAVDRDLVLIGDFNVPSLRSDAYAVLRDRGMVMPAALAGVHGTDLAAGKRYDQILVAPAGQRGNMRFTGRGGAVDFAKGGHRALYPSGHVGRREFTWEMSDHLPLWAEVAGAGRRGRDERRLCTRDR